MTRFSALTAACRKAKETGLEYAILAGWAWVLKP